MSRLFLASSLDQTIDKLNEKVPLEGLKVLFIEDAALPFSDTWNLFWVENDYKAFKKYTDSVERVNLQQLDSLETMNLKLHYLSGFDVMHCNGGDTKYLMAVIHLFHWLEPIRSAVREKSILYTGTSAGSMIVAPSLAGAGRLDVDPPSEMVQAILKPEFEQGLDLAPFLIWPHFNNKDFVPAFQETVRKTDYPHSVIFLNDNQAIWVEDTHFEIV